MADFVAPVTITPRLPMPHARYMGLSGTILRIAIGLTAGLCFLAFGYAQGDIGGLFVMRSFRDAYPQLDNLTFPTLHVANKAAIVVATWNLGCFAGAMLTIFVGDLLGRKGTITLGLVLMNIGRLIQVTSFSLGQYIAGRFLAGLGNGFVAAAVPAWQAECSRTHRRGTLLLVSFGSCITLGVAIAYWIDYAFSFAHNESASWRAPIAFGMIFMITPLLLITFLPESPRYLVLTGREEEAKRVISALNELSPEDEDVAREFLLIKHTLLHMVSGSVREAFRMGQHRYVHRTFLAVLLQIMQQFTGVNLFIQFLGGMFGTQLSYAPKTASLLAACCSTEFFLASLLAVVSIDRFWGRRALTMFGAAGMCVCMIVLAVMAYLDTQASHHVMTAILFLYCSFFSVGWQGMSWLWAVELIPLPTRGPANALSTAANWLANFIVLIATPVLFTSITYKTYIFFAVTNFCIVPTIFFLYPETGYRSLEEIDGIFSEASKASNPWCAVVITAMIEPLSREKDRSDSYASESGRTFTTAEKDEKGTFISRDSDAARWSQHWGERQSAESSMPIEPSFQHGIASLPPHTRSDRVDVTWL